MENYLMINGKRIDLTDEQIKVLTEEKKEYSNVIHKVGKFNDYFTMDSKFNLMVVIDNNNYSDDERFEKGNYYPKECENFAIQDALHDELRSRLRMFTRNHGWDENLWEHSETSKYYLFEDTIASEISVFEANSIKRDDIHFISEKIADRAIEEVVKPFMESHPDFVW